MSALYLASSLTAIASRPPAERMIITALTIVAATIWLTVLPVELALLSA